MQTDITEYEILEAASKETLMRQVSHAIVNGYQPLGGVAVTVEQIENRGRMENVMNYAQAMGK